MDKRLYALLALLLVGGLGYYLLVPRCQQPEPIAVALIQLSCAQSIDVGSFRAELCKQQHGTEDCQLDESDRPAGETLIVAKVNACAKAELEKQNKCIDKYEDL